MEKKWLLVAMAVALCAVIAVGTVLLANGFRNKPVQAAENGGPEAVSEALSLSLETDAPEPDPQPGALELMAQEKEALELQLADAMETIEALWQDNEAVLDSLTAAQGEAEELKALVETVSAAASVQLSAAEQEKEVLSAQLDAANQQNGELTAQINAVNEENARLRQSNAQLQASLSAAQDAQSAAQGQADALKSQAETDSAASSAQLTVLHQEKEALSAQLSEANQKIGSLTGELNASGQKNEALTEQLNAVIQENEDLTVQLNAAKMANETLAGKLSRADQEKDALTAQLTEANQKVGGLTEQVNAAARQNETLTKQLNAAQQDNEALTEQLTLAYQDYEGLKARFAAAGEENEALRQANAALQADLTAARNQAETLQTEKEAAEKALADCEWERDGLKRNLSILENSYFAVQSELTSLKTENQRLLTEKADAEGQLEATSQNSGALTEQLTASAQEKEQLSAQAEALRTELRQTEQEAQTAKNRAAALELALTEMQNALTAETRRAEALAAQTQTLEEEREAMGSELRTTAETAERLRAQLVKLLTALYGNGDGESVPDLSALTLQNIGLEGKAGALWGLTEARTEDNRSPALTVNGEAVSQAEAEGLVRSVLSVQRMAAEITEQDGGEAQTPDGDAILKALAENRVLWQQAEAAGLTELSQEEMDELNAAAQKLEEQYGLPAASFLPELTASYIMEKLMAYAGRDGVLLYAELNQALEERAAADEAAYRADPDAFGRSLESEDALYFTMPAAYRYVKHIYLPADLKEYKQLKEELRIANSRLEDAEYALYLARQEKNAGLIEQKKAKLEAQKEKTAAVQAAWDELEPRVSAQMEAAQQAIKDIQSQVKRGTADADALVAQYSADEAMPVTGYAVCKGCTHPFPEFVEEALKLRREGSWSAVIELDDGYHILYYSKDLTKDDQALLNARYRLRVSMLAEKHQAAAEETVARWLAEADVRVNMEMLEP